METGLLGVYSAPHLAQGHGRCNLSSYHLCIPALHTCLDQYLLKQDFIFKLMVQLNKYHLQTQDRESVSDTVDTQVF